MGDGKRRMRQFLYFLIFFLLFFSFFYLFPKIIPIILQIYLKIPISFNVLLKGAAVLSGGKALNGFKVRSGTIFRDLCNTIDQTYKNFVYLLFSRKSNRKRKRREFSNNTLKKYVLGDQEIVLHLQ